MGRTGIIWLIGAKIACCGALFLVLTGVASLGTITAILTGNAVPLAGGAVVAVVAAAALYRRRTGAGQTGLPAAACHRPGSDAGQEHLE
jgi:Flp pilus assembly protein TadB